MMIKAPHHEDTLTVGDVPHGETFRTQAGGTLLMACEPRGRLTNVVREDETMVVNLDTGEAFLMPNRSPAIMALAWISDPEEARQTVTATVVDATERAWASAGTEDIADVPFEEVQNGRG